MRICTTLALALMTATLTGLPVFANEPGAAHPPHWTYEGNEGPEHWGELAKEWGVCHTGKQQSPVNLSHMKNKDLPPLAFDYAAGGYRVVNNGHAVQVDFRPGSRLMLDGADFELKQLHFHSPSENTINGKQYPLEAHLVHADAAGRLAVVAVMIEAGADNAWLAGIAPGVPKRVQGESALATPVAATPLLPADRDYYRFEGSLTTPPCSEDVRWLVLKHPVAAGREQISQLYQAIGHDNNRPLQPLGKRVVLE